MAKKSAIPRTLLTNAQREKILYPTLLSIAREADRATRPLLLKALHDIYQDFYKKVFKTADEDKAFHLLAKRGLIDTVSKIRLRDIFPDTDELLKDNVFQMRAATRSGKPNSDRLDGKFIGYRGLAQLDTDEYLKLSKEWPEVLTKKIQYEGDQFAALRLKSRARVIDALAGYEEFVTVAVQVRGLIMTAKYVEDLVADLPDLASLITSVVTPKIQPPAVIDPAVGKVLGKLKPIEVAE